MKTTHEGIRFLFGGLINTGFTYLLYLALSQALGYQIAYFIAYVVGILFSYWYNTKFVFQTTFTWRKAFSFPLVYVVQYILSASLLAFFVERIEIPAALAPLLVTVCTVPVIYLLSKNVLR